VLRRTRYVPLLAGMLLAASACSMDADGGGQAASGEGKSEGKKVGIVVLTSAHPFYQAYQRHAEAAAREAGLEPTALDSENKVDRQQQNIEDLLSKSVGGVVLSPVDAASGKAAVQQATGQGVKVVTVAVKVDGVPVVVEDSYNAGFQGGEAAGKWLQKNHPDWKAKLGIVDIPQLEQTTQRVEGFIAGVKSVISDAQVVARQDGGAVLDKATSTAENMLQAHSDINVWFGANDDSALGALNALKGAGRGTKDKELVVGFDGSAQAVKALLDPNSALKVEIGNLPKDYATTAVTVLKDQLDGKSIKESNLVPVQILTSDTPESEVRSYYESQYGGKLD
jgi:ribose transport system substrate-binding protein